MINTIHSTMWDLEFLGQSDVSYIGETPSSSTHGSFLAPGNRMAPQKGWKAPSLASLAVGLEEVNMQLQKHFYPVHPPHQRQTDEK